MDNKELRKLVREALLKDLKIIKEYFDDEDDNFGEFDPNEFEGPAMDAARKDIGSEFEPLGKSRFEKNLNPDEFKADLQRQNLNLPSDKAELGAIKKNMAIKKAHEKKFGSGSLNETKGGLSKNDPLFNSLKELGFSPEVTRWGTIDIDIADQYGERILSFHKLEVSPGSESDMYTANLIWPPEEGTKAHVDKNVFIAGLKGALQYAEEQKPTHESPSINFTPEPAHVGPIVVGKIELPTDNKKRFKEEGVNPDSKIDRPKDAQGQPITLRARVVDLPTKSVGHVLRFGVDDNGRQTIHVEWIQNFGGEVPKTVTYPENIVVKDETRIVREEELEESSIRSHASGRGQNLKPGNYPSQLKRGALKENLDNAVDIDDEIFLVIDNDFNRSHYPDLVGKTFDIAPAYAQVKVVKKNEVQEDYDYSAEERDYYDKENLSTEKPTNEDYDYATAERNYHDTEAHKETQNLIGKNIVIKNKDEMTNLIFKNFKRINSIYDGIKDEIESHRVFNNTIAATDNMDTTWIFDVVGVDDENNNVYLEFTGTAK